MTVLHVLTKIYYEDIISDDDKEMIQAVVDKFAYCSATFLVNLTHNQDPWINAYVNGQRNDIKKSEKDGLRPKSLDSYAKKLQKICKFEVFSQSIDFTKELFYKEIAKRYFAE